MPGPSPTLRVRLKPELHQQFKATCERRGLSASNLALRAIQRELAARDDESTDSVLPHPSRPSGPSDEKAAARRRITLRLPSYIHEAASERAATRGLKISSWIAALVQSQVAATPVVTDEELQVLDESNRELAALGRNINQIARALNEAHFQTERVRLDRLAELSEQIERNRDAIFGLVRASNNAWGVVE